MSEIGEFEKAVANVEEKKVAFDKAMKDLAAAARELYPLPAWTGFRFKPGAVAPGDNIYAIIATRSL